MTLLTPEEMAQFRAYEESHRGEPISPETRQAILAEEMREKERSLERRLQHNRQYNHPPDKIATRGVAEEEI